MDNSARTTLNAFKVAVDHATAIGPLGFRLRAIAVRPGPLEKLPRLLVAADAHLISQRPEFSSIVLPSKVYGCIASRKPILFVGPTSSDVHALCRDADLPAYEHVEVGDIDGFAAVLARLAQRKQSRPFSNCPHVPGCLRPDRRQSVSNTSVNRTNVVLAIGSTDFRASKNKSVRVLGREPCTPIA